ncbi:DUF3302 domain-containing protein [Lysobacter sp. HA35]
MNRQFARVTPVTPATADSNASRRARRRSLATAMSLVAWIPAAHASFLQGEALDSLANGVAWVALIIVPVVLIAVFWIVHIMPEKIAEKRRHPQLSAIKTLCLLSLVFGGMLWPIAWLWAYTKPVIHKLAYGTDVDDTPHHGEALTPIDDAHAAPHTDDDVHALRQRIATLEAQLDAQSHAPRGSI